MPVETTGFSLKPVNFFDANPGLDIPPERNAASREVKSHTQLPSVSRQLTSADAGPATSAACSHCEQKGSQPHDVTTSFAASRL